LKKFYKTVETLKNNTSGFTWDDAKGLNVGPATESSFNTLVKVSGPTNIHQYKLTKIQTNGLIKRFKTSGWPHYDAMYDLMPHTIRGSNVFRPAQQRWGPAISLVSHPEAGSEAGHEDSDDGDHPPPPPSSPPNTVITIAPSAGPSESTRSSMCPLPPINTSDLSTHSIGTPSATSSSHSKRKRSALSDADSGIQSISAVSSGGKKQRSNPNAVLLSGLKEALLGVGTDIAVAIKATAPVIPDDSPARRARAKEKIQTDEPALDPARLYALIDLFSCNTEAADTYLALFREDVQSFWVEKQLTEHLGFPALSPLDMSMDM
jgi:hypothetical protein